MMGRSKKQYDDDDGRTIADMSQVSSSPAFFPKRPKDAASADGHGRDPFAGVRNRQNRENGKARPWEDNSLTLKERLSLVLGAMKATMFIAFAYLIGLAAVVWLLLKLWS